MLRLITVVILILTGLLFVSADAAKKPRRGPGEQDIAKITEAAPDKPYAEPAKTRRVLVFNLCKGFYHGSIPWGDAALRIIGEKTGAFTTESSEDMEAFRAENLKRFDAVILNNTTKLPFQGREDLQKSLMNFVKSGGGIIGIHAATDNFYDWPEAAEMMGGLFAGHPWGAGETVVIKSEEPDHPVIKMFEGKPFSIKDEIYQFKAPYDRSKMRILLSLDFENGTQKKGKRQDGDYAISWVRSWGKGRVFYCSLGHNNEVFWTPKVLRHYLAGIQYALGDLQAPDAPR